jgi:hypothetical protein
LWDNPAVTVIANNKKRVTLPTKPGERFDVQVVNDGQFLLTRLDPVQPKPNKVRFKKVNGFTVAETDQPIDMGAIKRALDEFP